MSEKIDNVDEWIDSLYKIDNEVVVEYAGKRLLFNRRLAMGVALTVKNQSEEKQNYMIIAMLSKNPKFTIDQAAKLPLDLITIIVNSLGLDSPEKKKLVQTPS